MLWVSKLAKLHCKFDVSGNICRTWGSLLSPSPLMFIFHFALFPLLGIQIMKEIQEHKIKLYEFPETDDEEEMKMVRKIKVSFSKAVFHILSYSINAWLL